MKKIIAMLIALTMLLSLLSGCSGKNKAETSVQSDSRTLTYAISADVSDFNPYTSQLTQYVYFFTFNCYEPLFHLNADMEYEMDLATSYEQIDDTTYNFKLREGVTFHNGEKFTAEDVIHTINYVKNPDNGSYKQGSFTNVTEVFANGDYDVTIKLSEPTPAFMDALAWLPITCKSVDPATEMTKPVGTGAFKFVSWTPNDKIQLEKYDAYWDAERIHFDNVVIKPYTDYTLAINGLYAGDVDFISQMSVEQVESIDISKGVRACASNSSNHMYLFEVGLHNVEAFQDANVMKAMTLVLDKNAINEGLFAGMGKVPTSVFPSGAKYHEDVNTSTYNLEEANALMAASNYPNGFEFEIMVLSGDTTAEMAAVIWKQELAKIGITMNINIAEMSVWLEAYLGRTYDMICNDYSMVGSDPATFCTVIIDPYADYQCKDMPELYEQIAIGASTTDDVVRQAAYSEIQNMIDVACPVISYAEAPNLAACVESLDGFTMNAMSHFFVKDATK